VTADALPDELRAFVRAAPVHRGAILAVVRRTATETAAGARVLDAGAGDAPYRPLFSHTTYSTHDWSASPHAGAREADIVADLKDLPVDAESFDLVLCTEVLEHVAEPSAALTEILRVLAPGGRLVATVPFVVELHEEPHDHYRYTSHGLRGLLERAGFDVESVEPLTGWFSTLAHTVRHAGLSMRPLDGPAPPATRATAFVLLCVSAVLAAAAPRLDQLDRRRALPLGWVAHARRPGRPGA